MSARGGGDGSGNERGGHEGNLWNFGVVICGGNLSKEISKLATSVYAI